MVRVCTLPVALLALVALTACNASSDGSAAAEAGAAPVEAATLPDATELPARAPTTSVPSPVTAATNAPQSLRFTAPLVGGGELDLATLADKPVLALDEPFASLDVITRQELQTWLATTLAALPRTVLLVTHDVEEALLLADRVVVMSPRPGQVVAELEVDLERPRVRTEPALVALRARALEAL